MVYHYMITVLLLCIAVIDCQKIPCVATEYIDQYYTEEWDFNLESWLGKTYSTVSSQHNLPPMSGEYTFEISFCDNVYVYVGNQTSGSLGWSFGDLLFFSAIEVYPPIPPSPPGHVPTSPANAPIPNDPFEYSAFKEFVQLFSSGDTGAPCESNSRSATVNIYCGRSKANCTQVPGNNGSNCLNTNGDTKNGFCLCGIEYNSTFGICDGLILNLLSNNCPTSALVPTPSSPMSPENSSNGVGIAFAVLGVIILVSIIGGYVYNFVVHRKRGCAALPFYDTCTGKKEDPTYHVAPASYGSLSD